MQKWQLSAFLSGALIVGVWLAPRLAGANERFDVQIDDARGDGVSGDEAPGAATADVGALSIRAGLDRSLLAAGEPNERFLVVELVADDVAAGARQSVDIALVVDTSGSMSAAGKIAYAREAAHRLVGALRPGDRFSLVRFNGSAQIVLPPTDVEEGMKIARAIDTLSASGGTNLAAGLAQGLYQMRNTEFDGVRRVVMLSDGLDSSRTHEELARQAGALVDDGVTVSALGLGLDFDEQRLLAISDGGGGRYTFVSQPDALSDLFAEELDQLSRVAARGVEMEVDLADGVELLEVYGYDGFDGRRAVAGYGAFMGDIYGGQTRKMVARVRVDPDSVAARGGEVATARVVSRAPTARSATVAGLSIRAGVSRDRLAVRDSRDAEIGAHAARAVAGVTMARSNALQRQGDLAAASVARDEGKLALREMSEALAVDVSGLVDTLNAQEHRRAAMRQGSEQAIEHDTMESLRALGYVE